jgi:hypothetical protein
MIDETRIKESLIEITVQFDIATVNLTTNRNFAGVQPLHAEPLEAPIAAKAWTPAQSGDVLLEYLHERYC